MTNGPKDWQNMFAITKFRYIAAFSIYFTIARTEYRSLYRGLCYIEVR